MPTSASSRDFDPGDPAQQAYLASALKDILERSLQPSLAAACLDYFEADAATGGLGYWSSLHDDVLADYEGITVEGVKAPRLRDDPAYQPAPAPDDATDFGPA